MNYTQVKIGVNRNEFMNYTQVKIGVNRNEYIFVRRLVQTTTQIEIEIYLCENKVINM